MGLRYYAFLKAVYQSCFTSFSNLHLQRDPKRVSYTLRKAEYILRLLKQTSVKFYFLFRMEAFLPLCLLKKYC
jgi:hypothetical protein